MEPQPQPQQAVPPVDTGNQLLGETPAQLTTTLVETPAGQRLALTIRTPSTTLTVLLQGTDAKTWASALTRDASAMSSSGLVIANGAMTPPPMTQR
jgi:hypothetical protein